MSVKSTKNPIPPDKVAIDAAISAGKKLLKVGEELTEIFPERQHMVAQMVYAIAIREHLLCFGMHGTGKSDLVHSLLRCISGASTFSIQFSKFMNEGYLFGLPNVKTMREEGRIEHCTEGSILVAQFAELDEIFDAPDPLLRSILGVLNERRFERGGQHEQALLHTAVASTNGSPDGVIARAPDLAAVVDRLIFHSHVDYLTTPEARRKMYLKYIEQAVPETTIDMSEILCLTTLIRSANQIPDSLFIEFYEKAVEAWRKALKDLSGGKRIISDRRACKLLKIAEASALFHGRFEVDPEDIMEIRYGACMGGDQKEFEAFDKAVGPVVEEAKQIRTSNPDESELKLLEGYEQKVPVISGNLVDGDLIPLKRELLALSAEVEAVTPKLDTTNARKKAILKKIADAQVAVQKKIDGEKP